MKYMLRVLYPGSFDPITKGHMNIVDQAKYLFGEVVIAVMPNSGKSNPMFTIDERLEIIKQVYKGYENVTVVKGEGTSVDMALLYGCKAIIRGMRDSNDFEGEFKMAQINNKITDNKIRTISLFPDLEYLLISSTVVKELFKYDKNIDDYTVPIVDQAMIKKRGVNHGIKGTR